MLSANSIALASLKQSEGALGTVNRVLLAVLNQSTADAGFALSARPVDVRCDSLPKNWARCDHNILIHVDEIGSRAHVFSEDRLDALAQALDTADPILSEIEAITGFVLDPIDMIESQPTEHAIVEISRANEIDKILLACPLDILNINKYETLVNRNSLDLSNTSVEYSLLIKSPYLDVDAVADLSIGDIVILGGGSVAATVIWQNENQTQFAVEGSYDFYNGRFASDSGLAPNIVVTLDDDLGLVSQERAPAFRVRLSVRVDGLTTVAGDLAAIQSGASFDVGRLLQGTKASVIFGENEIFSGDIVQIGDHIAVHIISVKKLSESAEEKLGEIGVPA